MYPSTTIDYYTSVYTAVIIYIYKAKATNLVLKYFTNYQLKGICKLWLVKVYITSFSLSCKSCNAYFVYADCILNWAWLGTFNLELINLTLASLFVYKLKHHLVLQIKYVLNMTLLSDNYLLLVLDNINDE